MVTVMSPIHQTSCGILNSMWAFNVILGYSTEQRVAIVQLALDEALDEGL